MFDVGKRIQYWTQTARSNLDSAGVLIQNKKFLEGLFFCHLTIEKLLKAHVEIKIKREAPRIHNLRRLLIIANLEVPEELDRTIDVLMVYQLEGRYPENYPSVPSRK